MHLHVGDHVPKLAAEAAEQREDKGTIVDGVAELGEGHGHHLKAMAEVGDRERPLLGHAEFSEKQQGVRLTLAKKLMFKEGLGDTSVREAQHHRLLEVAVDGAKDLGKDDAVHLQPCQAIGIDHISENVIG